MSATESLAAVDTICVDKTGTLTDGELRLVGVEFAEGVDPAAGARGAGPLRRQRRRPQPHPGGDRRALSRARPARVRAEVPFSSEWKWSGLALIGASRLTYVLGAPDVLAESGALTLPPGLARKLEARDRGRAARRRLRRSPSEPLPADPAQRPAPRLAPLALVVLEETLRPDAAETIALMREQEVDLKLISGDARATVTAVAYAVGVPRDAGVIEGPELPEDRRGGWPRWRSAQHDLLPDQAGAEESAWSRPSSAPGRYAAMIGDGVNDVPALKRARMAVAMGSGAQVTKGVADVVLLKDEFSRLPRGGRRGTADRPQHPPPRPPLPDQDRLRGGADPARRDARLRLPLPPPPPHPGRLPDDRRSPPSCSPWRPPTGRSTAAACCARWPPSRCRPGLATALGSILSFFLVDTVFGGSLEAGRTAATTTLIVLGLAFVLLLERGPGREHIAIQSYMLALVAGLGALYAGILAIAPPARASSKWTCSARPSGSWRCSSPRSA